MERKRPTIDEILGRTWWVKAIEYLDDQRRYYFCKWFGHSKPYLSRFSGDYCARCHKLMVSKKGLRVSVIKVEVESRKGGREPWKP